MDDTTPEISEKICEMFQRKTPVERLKMGYSMYATSKYLVIRAILNDEPGISEERLRQELFLKFYANDFTSEQKDKILCHFAALSSLSKEVSNHAVLE